MLTPSGLSALKSYRSFCTRRAPGLTLTVDFVGYSLLLFSKNIIHCKSSNFFFIKALSAACLVSALQARNSSIECFLGAHLSTAYSLYSSLYSSSWMISLCLR
jgi:hypothetical protein